ncbi:UDP-N-acetylmuramyl peptide synthase [Virgibacillus phasianinus]|uniref:UDP-N-acetylmuramyl peptide synthase n=1 Tax=Virgibacillus phasianinus TaxID=2017483 RepID=A0A220U1M5_9BACI|nr:UDP-N-acetylmuramyl-tripeptide synthetase [Virgibacillus phasianinus]ASK61945.1 UDP-N-acetylmuramyl peptide synthase [Virgibacillus phasianinus]
MKLDQLLKSIDVINNSEVASIDIEGVAYHSQMVSDNYMFVCVKGREVDGHSFISDAEKRGAKVAVVEDLQDGVNIPQIVVKDTRQALAQIGSNFYHQPSKHLKMIGITATNGKTSTSYMTNAIFENAGLKTGLIGTVTVKIDDHSISSKLTTPESLDLQYYLNQMVEKNVSHVSMEVSSAALEMQRVNTVHYDIVALNNVSREHIDTHGSFERYFEVKSSLIRDADEESFAVLNLDNPYAASLVDQTKAKVITFGIENKDGHIHCKGIDLTTGRATFKVEILKPFKTSIKKFQPSTFDIALDVPGLHSVYNAMVAITIALLSDIPITTIQRTLKEFLGVPRRFEFIYEDEIKIVDDHFANPGNINVTLGTLQQMAYNNLHIVYAIRGSRGVVINRENAEAVVEHASKLGLHQITATKSVSHVTAQDEVTDKELEVFLDVMEQANINVTVFDELPNAIHHALADTAKDDLVLLAGCQGMDYGAGIALGQLYKENVADNKGTIQ